jgi:hypothetical protein
LSSATCSSHKVNLSNRAQLNTVLCHHSGGRSMTAGGQAWQSLTANRKAIRK